LRGKTQIMEKAAVSSELTLKNPHEYWISTFGRARFYRDSTAGSAG
jgi:hypothetical protein